MILSKQLAELKDQAHYSGWALVDADNGVKLDLFTDGEPVHLRITKDDFAGTQNEYGEALPFGTHRNGSWSLVERAGQRVLVLFRSRADTRPGSQFYFVVPLSLSRKRTAELRCGLTVHVVDGYQQTAYSVQDGVVGACTDGTDRGEYREAAENFLKTRNSLL